MAAIAPILIAIAAFLVRIINLGSPKGLVFDEVYYVDGARDLLKYGVEVSGSDPEFIVHPPVGKWLIASGIKLFGDNEFGWRFASAVFGTLLILLFARLVHVLFYSPLLTALGAVLMALDGLLLVHSRTALLDLFLTFFTLLGIFLWHRNRHIWAGIAFRLAIGCKWSAIYFVAIIGLIAVYRVLIAHDIRKTLKPIAAKFAQYGLIPVFVYTLTWTGWFLLAAGYLPWFAMQQRTVFTFYAIIIEPFLILAIVYCAKLLLASGLKPVVSQSIVGGILALIILCFLFFIPLFTGQVITYEDWNLRMWFDSWI